MLNEIIDYTKLPTLDLHNEIKDVSKILIKEFILENYKLKNYNLVIIHGKSSNILKKTTLEELKNNILVFEYKICFFNDGITLVKLKENYENKR